MGWVVETTVVVDGDVVAAGPRPFCEAKRAEIAAVLGRPEAELVLGSTEVWRTDG